MFVIKHYHDNKMKPLGGDYMAFETDRYHIRYDGSKAQITCFSKGEILGEEPIASENVITIHAGDVAYIENSIGKTIDKIRPYGIIDGHSEG